MDLCGTGWDLQGSFMEGLGGERETKPEQADTLEDLSPQDR